MPKGIRRKNKGKGGDRGGQQRDAEGKRGDYNLWEVKKDNQKLWDYYKAQGLIPEAEWHQFVQCLKDDLPTAFRVQGCHRELDAFIDMMKDRFFDKIEETEGVHKPHQLPWLKSAFQTRMPRSMMRSNPALKELHNFLVTEAEIGNISRQEAVSMLPPLLLDVQPHHKVIDVCAAPGSKTMQLIEMMHAESDNPDGLVVANDIDNSRCYLLVRQALKRMPAPSCVVINEDASILPNMKKANGETMLFDRVLCDVICSGDGTFRKNIELWKSWTPQAGIGLHRLQVNIARRALEILEVGGRMVYSTCSLNPIEDEAVLAELLRHFEGTVELVDVEKELPELKRSPGVNKWKVIDRDLNEYASHDDVPTKLKRPIQQSMFPPTEEEAEKYHLNRSFRVFPHAQDTGGFFVAVLTKTGHLKEPKTNGEEQKDRFEVKPPASKKRKMQGYLEDPFVFMAKDDDRFKNVADYYGIRDSFPAENLLSRSNEDGPKRTLYFVNGAVREFLQNNRDNVKVINAGVKMFGRTETKFTQCMFRLAQDGLKIILPHLGKRVVTIDREEMDKIMRGISGNPNYPREGLQCDKALGDLESGSVVLKATHGTVEKSICAWIGQQSVSPYISKEERIHVIRMLGFDTSELEDEMSSKRKSKAMKGREGHHAKSKAENGEPEAPQEDSMDSGCSIGGPRQHPAIAPQFASSAPAREAPKGGIPEMTSTNAEYTASETHFVKKTDILYGCAFNHYLEDDWPCFLAVVGSQKLTIFGENEDGKLEPIIQYEDPNPDEKLFAVAWVFDEANDRHEVVIGGKIGMMRVVDATNGRVWQTLIGHGGAVNEIRKYPRNERIIASASFDLTIRLWNIHFSECLAILGGTDGHTDQVLSIDIEENAEFLISGGMDHSIKVWNIGPGTPTHRKIENSLKPASRRLPVVECKFPWGSSRDIHGNYVDCVRFVGDFIFSKSTEKKIVLWKFGEIREGAAGRGKGLVLETFACHMAFMNIPDLDMWFMKMDVDPYRKYLAAGTQTGLVRFWALEGELPSKDSTFQVKGNGTDTATKLCQTAFSHNGKMVVAVGSGGIVVRLDKKEEEVAKKEEERR
ncbi:hypothetical protein L596_008197 [Steinernema carpocapsae]|uniref:tRNA (cytosine(34)-C(5))-methyltransferase n=2 Tax=Steinernema carpocapsae TaxID=34508 RepID=A0A4U5PBQ2_STECR|nr:hypothetical protein L596_008197 [Steinernema carpocapsae]